MQQNLSSKAGAELGPAQLQLLLIELSVDEVKEYTDYIRTKCLKKQDGVAFMSQPYWVEVEMEAEVNLSLRSSWVWGWNLVEAEI